jgi:hypothetical protein
MLVKASRDEVEAHQHVQKPAPLLNQGVGRLPVPLLGVPVGALGVTLGTLVSEPVRGLLGEGATAEVDPARPAVDPQAPVKVSPVAPFLPAHCATSWPLRRAHSSSYPTNPEHEVLARGSSRGNGKTRPEQRPAARRERRELRGLGRPG